MSQRVRIATRSTPLALIQTEMVAELLRKRGLEVERIELRTRGDQSLGGNLTVSRGMFTVELDSALLDGRADLAVHSLKDLPVELNSSLGIVAIPERSSPCDLLLMRRDRAPESWLPLDLVLKQHESGADQQVLDASATQWPGLSPALAFSGIDLGASLGTSSPRRQAGALALRPDLVCCAVRGSVGRRLEWLESGAVDALLLAEAGLKRLAADKNSQQSYSSFSACRLEPHAWPPAPGQGALAIVAALASPWFQHPTIMALADPRTTEAVLFERALLERLGGGCSLPFAAYRDRSLASASLAPLEWREQARRSKAPEVFRVHRHHAGTKSDEIALELQTLTSQARGPGAVVALTTPPELVVTASPEATDRLTASLADTIGRSPTVIDLAVTRTRALDIEWPAERVHEILTGASSRRRWPWLLVTSPNAGRILVERSATEPVWASLPWCALGAGTARALLGLESPPNLAAGSRNASEFADFAGRYLQDVSALFLPQSELADDRLSTALAKMGFEVHCFSTYTQEPAAPSEWPTSWNGVPERILFTSPSAVFAVADSDLKLPAVCWAMGERTAEAMESRGIKVSGSAGTPTAQGVAALWI